MTRGRRTQRVDRLVREIRALSAAETIALRDLLEDESEGGLGVREPRRPLLPAGGGRDAIRVEP